MPLTANRCAVILRDRSDSQDPCAEYRRHFDFNAVDTMTLIGSATAVENPGNKFTQTLDAAAKLPGVRIDRAKYLRTALKPYCTEEQIEIAVQKSPAAAGIPRSVIAQVANTSIAYETSKVTGLSTVAGIPGGLATVGTVPADLVQYMGHMLRAVQKLAYVYSWPDLFLEEEEIDESTEGMLVLFVGVMFGVQLAQGGVTKVAAMVAANVAKKLPQQALTKGVIYPIVKKVAGYAGVNMTKKLFASGIAKAIPVVGAVLSGGLTLGTFLPMSKRLQKYLASLELTKPAQSGGDAADQSEPTELEFAELTKFERNEYSSLAD